MSAIAVPAEGFGPIWVWHFIVFMTVYNFVKYPVIMAARPPTKPYRISSIVGGTVVSNVPHWFLVLHVPLMVASNVLAAVLGYGTASAHAGSIYLACVVLESANLVALLPPAVHRNLGSGHGVQPTIVNLGSAGLMVALMWLSYLNPASRWSYFTYGFAIKCIGIFGAEMLALVAVLSSKPKPAQA